jgi:hypothetical protein
MLQEQIINEINHIPNDKRKYSFNPFAKITEQALA